VISTNDLARSALLGARSALLGRAPTRIAGVAVGFSIALAIAYPLTPRLARLDDAYIALHSARVVLSGQDPIFGVAGLVGATSPAYVALLVGILRLGLGTGAAALRVANAVGLIAYAAAVWYLAGAAALTRIRRLALLAIALASGLVMVNLTNGMETGWAMATLTFLIGAAYAGRLFPVACCAGLLPSLRPDLAPAAGLVMLYALAGRPRTQQVRAVLLALIVGVPWVIWTRWDTGEWLPQTMRAKQLFYAAGCLPWTTKAISVFEQTVSGLVRLFPLSLGLIALWRDKLGRIGLLAMAISLIAYFIALPGALASNFSRYLYAIVVPWLCLGSARGLARIESGIAMTAAIAVSIVHLATIGRGDPSEFGNEIKSSAEWLDTHVPPDAVLLVHDAGGVSEFAHLRAVDIVGLKTPSSIAAHARWTWPTCGVARGTALAAIARNSRASHLVALTGWNASLRADLEAQGFSLTTIRPAPPLERAYTVYRLQKRD
jgi:hypothetical protein